MENGQEQINNKTGRNVAKFAGCFIGTCLLSAALFLLWCGISYSMRLSVELIRVGITAWYALSGLIGGKILRACKCGAIPFCAVMLGGFFFGISYSMRLSVELIRVGITAWYALSGLIGGKILRACKCGAIPFCAVMLGGFFFGILYVCSCIREQHWIALEGENLTILILCTAAALLGSVRWKKK